jgi:DNA-binding NarL/FixJ family response regulator
MKKIRVLLANYPMMMPTGIRTLIEEQNDMEVVGDCRGPMKILQETGRTKADAVILAQEGTDEPGLCSQLLAVYPDITILSVVHGQEMAYTQQLRSHRKELACTQVQAIAETLRIAVREVGGKTSG